MEHVSITDLQAISNYLGLSTQGSRPVLLSRIKAASTENYITDPKICQILQVVRKGGVGKAREELKVRHQLDKLAIKLIRAQKGTKMDEIMDDMDEVSDKKNSEFASISNNDLAKYIRILEKGTARKKQQSKAKSTSQAPKKSPNKVRSVKNQSSRPIYAKRVGNSGRNRFNISPNTLRY